MPQSGNKENKNNFLNEDIINLDNKFIYSDENYKSPFKIKNFDEEFYDESAVDKSFSTFDNKF